MEWLKTCFDAFAHTSRPPETFFKKRYFWKVPLSTEAEYIQFVNLRPKQAVEIQLIIENSEERLTEEQIEKIIATLKETLPGKDEEEEEVNGEEEGDEGAEEGEEGGEEGPDWALIEFLTSQGCDLIYFFTHRFFRKKTFKNIFFWKKFLVV